MPSQLFGRGDDRPHRSARRRRAAFCWVFCQGSACVTSTRTWCLVLPAAPGFPRLCVRVTGKRGSRRVHRTEVNTPYCRLSMHEVELRSFVCHPGIYRSHYSCVVNESCRYSVDYWTNIDYAKAAQWNDYKRTSYEYSAIQKYNTLETTVLVNAVKMYSELTPARIIIIIIIIILLFI